MSTPAPSVKITYFLEVVSSWCYWAEPTWAELQKRYAGRVDFQWKIALMQPGDFPVSRDQCDWFYRRSGTLTRSPFMLNSGWFEAHRLGDYTAPNLVAEAARTLGASDDRIRLALSHAAVREGQKVGDLATAIQVAAHASGLAPEQLLAATQAPETAARIHASTAEFHALKVSQRPAFLLENTIGDRAVFSGLASTAPLAVALDALLADAQAYQAYAAHFGPPPKA